MHIADAAEEPLASGMKLQLEWPLYTHYETKVPFTFMMLSQQRGQTLDRLTLSNHFLVAYEVVRLRR